MPPDPFATSPEISYDLDFNPVVAGHYNRDLGGRGTLLVFAREPRYVFTGKPRGAIFSAGAMKEVRLRSDQIRNLIHDGSTVSFITPEGESGKRKVPFVFTCASPADAAAVAAALPDNRDAEFHAEESFLAKVRQLPRPAHPLLSVTRLLLIANVVVFIFMGLQGAGWLQVASMEPYRKFGANNLLRFYQGEWWRLVTCMFLHYGLLHLLFNSWALFQVGPIVERLYGRLLFVLLYLGSGLTGSLGTLLRNSDRIWSAGASGAVFGIYGALLGYLLREKQGMPAGVFRPMLQSTLMFAGYNLLFGFMHPNVDNAAHLGGLVGGALLGWTCALPLDLAERDRVRMNRALSGLIVATGLVVFGFGLVLRLRR